jgi:NADH dehydrogenase
VHLVVIGGGYAGVMAANRLAGKTRRQGYRVSLINERGTFIERIRLHEYVAGTRATAVVPFRDLLNPRVNLLVDRVTRIIPAEQQVDLQAGRTLEYDFLVYAVGSSGGAPAPDALDFSTAETAAVLRTKIAELSPGARVTVRGGGLTGIEVAGELAAARPDLIVHLAHRGVGTGLGEAGSRAVTQALTHAGVTLAGPEKPERVEADVIIRAAGFSASPLARVSGLPTDADGYLLVSQDQTVEGHPQILGAGDSVHILGVDASHLRMGCATALPQGAHAADMIIAMLDTRATTPLSAGLFAQCISVGRASGVIQFVRPNDSPRALRLHGRPAAVFKEWICNQTLRWLASEARSPGSYRWPKGPETAAARRRW